MMIMITRDKDNAIVIETDLEIENKEERKIDLEVKKDNTDKDQLKESINIYIYRHKNDKYKGYEMNKDKIR